MSDSNKPGGNAGPLRVGLIADRSRLHLLAERIRACPLLELSAIVASSAGDGVPDVPRFDDPRVLLAERDLQAVLLANSTRADAAIAELAAEQGLHVWRWPPVACSFAESVELRQKASHWNTIYRVSSWWEHVAEHAWHEMRWPAGFEPRYSELRASGPGPIANDWRTLGSEAAGGALADVGYRLLEALIAVRGLPESVAASIVSSRRGAEAVAPRETEDVAIALLRFDGGRAALVRASWDAPPTEYLLVHFNLEWAAQITDQQVTLMDRIGAVSDMRPLPADFLAAELIRFGELVRAAARDRAIATLDRHLAVSALLEAIYLASRTNQPEAPRKLYEMLNLPEPRA